MTPAERNLENLVLQFSEMIDGVINAQDIDKFELSSVLRFLSKMIQVVEQAFQEVLSLLIEFKYITENEIQLGRLMSLIKEMDLLMSRSLYRDALEICSRLHHLSDFYAAEIEPITRSLPDSARWTEIYRLLDEYEGRIIGLVTDSLGELKILAASADVKQINAYAQVHSQKLSSLLSELRQLNASILGLSGKTGLIELVRIGDHPQPRSIQIGRLSMSKEEINISGQAQVGAAGSNAHAHDMTFIQAGQLSDTVDLRQLATELAVLRQAMKTQATQGGAEVEDLDSAIGDVVKAEKAAKADDRVKVAEYLKSAGKWALDIASKIGVSVATEALKQATGLR